MINHNTGVGDCSIAWDVACERKKMVLVPSVIVNTSLHQAMEFFAHCLEPQIPEQEIVIGHG
jgi:hypothetical protein